MHSAGSLNFFLYKMLESSGRGGRWNFFICWGNPKKEDSLLGWIKYGRHRNLIGSFQITLIYCFLKKFYLF